MAAIELPVAWYVYRAGHQHGPMPDIELALLAKTKVLVHTDLIWCEGLPDWIEAGGVTGLLPANEEARPKFGGLTQAYFDARKGNAPKVRALSELSRSNLPAPTSRTPPSNAASYAESTAVSAASVASKYAEVAKFPLGRGRLVPSLPLEFAAAPAM